MLAKKKALVMLLVILLTVAVFPVGVHASMGFSVTPNIPGNQVGDVTSYFDLLVQPGQVQDISITVSNQSDEDIVVTVEAVTASTNRNGIVVYTDADAELDDSVPFRFSDIAQAQESPVVIPAHSDKIVAVTLRIPDEEFDGLILGAVHMIKQLTDEERESAGMIVNQYSYVIGAQLRMRDSVIQPDFRLGSVQADLVNYRASFVAKVHNTTPSIVRNVNVSAEIFPARSNTAIFEINRADVTFAPNAVYPLTMTDEAGYGIQAGNYIAKVLVTHEDKSWEFEQEFTIEAEEAAVINTTAVNQTEQTRMAGSGGGLPIWAVIALCVGAVILVVVVVLLILMVRRTKALAEAAAAKPTESSSSDSAPKQQSSDDGTAEDDAAESQT